MIKRLRKDRLTEENFKWATIQGCSSMFRSARALRYSKGYREKSHYVLLTAIRGGFPIKDLLIDGRAQKITKYRNSTHFTPSAHRIRLAEAP